MKTPVEIGDALRPEFQGRSFAELLDWSYGSKRGGRSHDARIAALCLLHRVEELWTADRDLGAFPELGTRNPLVAGTRN